MKKLNLYIAILFSVLFLCNLTFAQQDYDVVQKFKSQYKTFENEIKNANSLTQLDSLQSLIADFRLKYQPHENLLDKSLYPDGFNGSLEKLDDALMVRRGDFNQITNLQTQVSAFKVDVQQLNQKNAELMSNIEQLQLQSSNDKKTIARLNRDVRELRYSMYRRDKLIMTMLDSLIPNSAVEGGQLSTSEAQKIYSRAKKTDVISSLKNAIDENIKFLEVTTLTPKDLSSIKKQQDNFENLWRNVGPQIIKIYSSRREDTKNLQSIDSAFTAWHYAINQEAWNSIRQQFSDYGINLNRFSNGLGFTNAVVSYIDDEIKTASVQGSDAEKHYKVFADSVWFKNVSTDWLPYLTENNLITESNKDTIEAKIKEWKTVVMPNTFNWLYIIIAVLIIVIIVLAVKKSKSPKEKFDDVEM